MRGFEEAKRLAIPPAMIAHASALFTSARIDADSMALAMRKTWETSGQLLDPHTAIGLAAAQGAGLPRDVPIVTLATAHPAKFPDAVERATGQRPMLPTRIGDLFDREERLDTLPCTLEAVEAFIGERAVPA
jgi:threonine synthase